MLPTLAESHAAGGHSQPTQGPMVTGLEGYENAPAGECGQTAGGAGSIVELVVLKGMQQGKDKYVQGVESSFGKPLWEFKANLKGPVLGLHYESLPVRTHTIHPHAIQPPPVKSFQGC